MKRKCNKCGNKYSDIHFKNLNKKTCRYCEFRWWRSILRSMVKERKLSPVERIANRVGYMGTSFIMMSPYLLQYGDIGGITYVIGGLLSMPQVFIAKQWNLVAVNMNVTIGYLIYLMNFYGII